MAQGQLNRTLTLADAAVVGLGSMIGAGVFAVWEPAARAAGKWLLLALVLAAAVATCNALSSARLAALYPESGGTYVYGRERLGRFWGYLAGWAFVVGKTASCAAMGMTFGAYAWPGHATEVGMAAVAAVTALNLRGAQRSVRVMRVLVGVVILTLGVIVALVLGTRPPGSAAPSAPGTWYGALQGAGLLFFAFAGYARVATMGEEVREPRRNIPRAIMISLALSLAVYAAVAWSLSSALGPAGMASAGLPLRRALVVTGHERWATLLAFAACLACLGALLNLLLGVSRTLLAMARDGWWHRGLATVSEDRHAVPWVAEVTVAVVVSVLLVAADLRGAIGFSSFGVLTYYAIANASACTLDGRARLIGGLGLLGCLVLAWAMPWQAVAAGALVLLAGAGWYVARRRHVAAPALRA